MLMSLFGPEFSCISQFPGFEIDLGALRHLLFQFSCKKSWLQNNNLNACVLEYDMTTDCCSRWSFSLSPWRIVDDCGGAFTMGAIGGGIFQAVKGFRNAPSVSSLL